MEQQVKFTLSYKGNESDNHAIDLYDVSQAIVGFQRSLALTTHLILNNQIITQAPSLKGAKILALPAEEGSWKITAIIITGMFTGLTAPVNTPFGHLVHSLYDYVISESLGFHVDYDKSLGQLYEEYQEKNFKIPIVKEHQVDSLIEKCHTAVTELHRPIFKNKTATQASIFSTVNNETRLLQPTLDMATFDHIRETFKSDEVVSLTGNVSSYNSNTYKGRIYVPDEGRPVAFELSESIRNQRNIQKIVESLSTNALRKYVEGSSAIKFKALRKESRSGYLKGYEILSIEQER